MDTPTVAPLALQRIVEPPVDDEIVADLRAGATLASRLVRRGVEDIIQAGRVLIALKDRHPGHFLRLFPDHPHYVPNDLGLGKRQAQSLMRVANHPILGDAQNSALPLSLDTRDTLARLDLAVLQQAMASGLVYREMTGKDADKLVRRDDQRKEAARRDRGDQDEIDALVGSVDSTTMFWGANRLERLAVALREKCEQLDRRVAELQNPAAQAREVQALQRVMRPEFWKALAEEDQGRQAPGDRGRTTAGAGAQGWTPREIGAVEPEPQEAAS